MLAKRFRNYIIDTKTRNMSFLQTAADLRVLGVKNNTFFLKLYNKELQGVDPHAPFLTQDTQLAIINECMINIWYFLREVVRIPDSGGKGIPYQLNRANLAAAWCFEHNIDHYLTIPRQIGKTQSTISNFLWAFLFGTTNSDMIFMNKSQDDANKNLKRLKDQRDLLPKFLQLKAGNEFINRNGEKEKDTDNVKTIYSAITKNSISTKPSARSAESATNIGRGNTIPLQYSDETEFSDFIEDIIIASGPAYKTAADNAKRNHAAYCRVFTSTPGDLDSNAGAQAKNILDETIKWSESWYSLDINQVKDIITTSSKNKIVYIEYSYKQLGKDERWFREVCSTVNGKKIAIRREILLQRIHGSSLSPFDPEDLMALNDLKGTIKKEILINQLFTLYLYDDLDKKIPYLVGVDVSSGGGMDNSAVTIINPYTLKVVGEFESPYMSKPHLKRFLYVLVKKYIPKAVLCIERNYADGVIADLKETDIRYNIYFDKDKDLTGIGVDEKLDAKGYLQMESKRSRSYGVWTGTKSRPEMMDILFTHMEEHKDKIIGEKIIRDIGNLVRTRTGKIAAAAGKHDDSIMSYLIALYVYYHGTNLKRFGITPGYNPGKVVPKTPEEEYMEAYKELPEEMQNMFKGTPYKSQKQLELENYIQSYNAKQELDVQFADNSMVVNKSYNMEHDFDMRGGRGKKSSSSFFSYMNDM